MEEDLRSSSEESRDTGAYMRLWLKLILRCVADGAEDRARVDFVGELETITACDLKNRIEYMYKIPRSLQRLYHEENLLRDEDASLTENRIREGDIITVEYSTTADIDNMMEAIEIIIQVKKLIKQQLSPECTSTDIPRIFSIGTPNNIYNIFYEYCMGSSLRSRANRHVFASNDGFDYLFSLYRLILDVDYASLPYYIRQLESLLIQVVGVALTSFDTRLPEVQKLILDHSALECTMRSFMRAAVPSDKWLTAPPGCRDKMEIRNTMQDSVLASLLQFAQFNLSNLAKVPSLMLKMASNETYTSQLLAMAHCPSYNSSAVVVTVNTLNSLARCRDAHVYLTSPHIVNGLLKTVKVKRPSMYSARRHDHLILRQSVTNLFTALLSQSADIIPLPMKLRMHAYVATMFRENNMDAMQAYKNDHTCGEDIIWTFLSMVYSPHDLTDAHYSNAHNGDMKILRDLCLKFGLLNMHDEVMRKKEVAREAIAEDCLTDFVACLPWYMVAEGKYREKMEVLMDVVRDSNYVKAPSLLSLCKARLARVWFGLEKVLNLSVQEMAIEWTQL